MSEPGEQISRVKPSVEIIHVPGFDIYLNRSHPNPEHVRSVFDKVKGGIPQGWEEMSGKKNMFIDDKSNPQLVAKIRRHADPNLLQSARRRAVSVDRFSRDRWDTETINAFYSLASEINIAPSVATLLHKQEVSDIVKKYGFGSINLVEPLLGLIAKDNQEKIMLYDYVDGLPLNGDKSSVSESVRDGLVEDLKDFFWQNKIAAKDLASDQLLISTKSQDTLYLTDIEAYTRLP